MNVFLLIFSTAFADMAPPPLKCPKGSLSTTKSKAQWCRELICTTDADCVRSGPSTYFGEPRENLKCEAVSLCIEQTTRTSRQRFLDKVQEKKYDVEHVLGDCDQQGGCAKGSCSTRKRCYSVLPPSTEKPEEKQSETPQQAQKPQEQQTEITKTEASTAEETGCQFIGSRADVGWWLILMAVLVSRRTERIPKNREG